MNEFKDHDECDCPAPVPPHDGTIRVDKGRRWVWWDGSWWRPETLPKEATAMWLCNAWKP